MPADINETIGEEVLEHDERVEHSVDEDGNEVIKVIRVGEKECASEQVVEVFEDRKILAKRITEYVKPVVYKVKTEILDECGNVVDIIVEEIDEGTMVMGSHHEEPVVEPVMMAQSVPVQQHVKERHIKVPYQEMSLWTAKTDRYFTHKRRNCCDD